MVTSLPIGEVEDAALVWRDGVIEWVGRRHDPAEFGSPARALAARAGLLCVHTEDRAVRCLGKGTQGELGRIPAGVALEPVEVRPFGP